MTFRPYTAADASLMNAWLAQPHMQGVFDKDWTVMDEENHKIKYGLPVANDSIPPVLASIVYVAEKPVGYIQAYRNADWPQYSRDVGLFDGISMDFFIGEPAFLGRGIGRMMKLKFLDEVAFPQLKERICYLNQDPDNIKAIRSSEAAGFRYVRNIVEEGHTYKLMAIDQQTVRNILRFGNAGKPLVPKPF